MDEEIVLLEDDNGEKIQCVALGTYEFNDKIYGAFIQVMPDGTDSEDVIILECEPIDDGQTLDLFPVEDDEELEAAYNEFIRIYYEEDEDEE
ncbi:MAG: DUF1292 domain-containing protein [Clostridia bacterium]|nr:DUF1292 domain-containing protein [Clostridia bacterium]